MASKENRHEARVVNEGSNPEDHKFEDGQRAKQSRWSRITVTTSQRAKCVYSSGSTSPTIADTNGWKPVSNLEQSSQWSKQLASSLEGAQACTIGVYSFGPGQQICLPALTPANKCECTLLNPACELLRTFLAPYFIRLARWYAPPFPVSLVSAGDSGPLVQRVDGLPWHSRSQL